MDALLIGMRFVQYMAVMVLFGSSLFPYYALRRDETKRGFRNDMARFLQCVALIASLAGLLSAVGWLGCEAVLMSGDASAYREGDTLLTVLNRTEFGAIWRWRLILLAVLPIFLGWRILGRYTPLIWPILVSGLVLDASLAGVGHGAMGIGFSVWIHQGNQAIHFLAAAVWVGGLLPLFTTLRAARKSAIKVEELSAALKGFSSVGLVAVVFILASGIVNSWFLVGSIHALLYRTYGQVLMVKISFFLCMIALALFNRLFLMPQLGDDAHTQSALRRLLRSVALEQIFAVLVVATVSVLGLLPPTMDMPGMAM